MIDDIVFHHEGFQETGMMTALVLTAIELVIFCYCALAPRFGMRGKQWKEMQRRLAVEQSEKDRSAQIAGVVGTQAAARLLKNSDNETKRNLAARQKSPLPQAPSPPRQTCLPRALPTRRLWQRPVACLSPVQRSGSSRLWRCPSRSYAAPISAAGAGKHRDAGERRGRGRADRHRTQGIRASCEYVSADDPYERYQDYGYHVRGYLHDGDSDTQKTYTYLDFDNKGTLTEVSYAAEIDPDASLEDNLARIELDLDALSSVVQTIDVKTASPELLAPQKLPEEFRQAFLNGSLYERISIRTSDDPVKRITRLIPIPRMSLTNTPIQVSASR